MYSFQKIRDHLAVDYRKMNIYFLKKGHIWIFLTFRTLFVNHRKKICWVSIFQPWKLEKDELLALFHHNIRIPFFSSSIRSQRKIANKPIGPSLYPARVIGRTDVQQAASEYI